MEDQGNLFEMEGGAYYVRDASVEIENSLDMPPLKPYQCGRERGRLDSGSRSPGTEERSRTAWGGPVWRWGRRWTHSLGDSVREPGGSPGLALPPQNRP